MLRLSTQDNGESHYRFIKCGITTCPECKKKVYLLTSDQNSQGKPSFFICFDCKHIGEVGVGLVKEARE